MANGKNSLILAAEVAVALSPSKITALALQLAEEKKDEKKYYNLPEIQRYAIIYRQGKVLLDSATETNSAADSALARFKLLAETALDEEAKRTSRVIKLPTTESFPATLASLDQFLTKAYWARSNPLDCYIAHIDGFSVCLAILAPYSTVRKALEQDITALGDYGFKNGMT